MSQRVSAVAEYASCNQLHDLTVIYQQPGEPMQVTGTITGTIPRTASQISAAHERVKLLCFQVERALWTSTIPLQNVTVIILGPVLDDYFDQIISWYGTATLAASAAARLDWSALGADQAWTLFDNTQLRVNFDTFQGWGITPVPTASSSDSVGQIALYIASSENLQHALYLLACATQMRRSAIF
jgi:hypothetical protein